MRTPGTRLAIVRLYILGSLALAALVGFWVPVATLPRPNGFAAIEGLLQERPQGRALRQMPVYVPPATIDPGMPRVRPDSGGFARLSSPGPRATRYVR